MIDEAFERALAGPQQLQRLHPVAAHRDRRDLGRLTERAVNVHHVEIVVLDEEEVKLLRFHHAAPLAIDLAGGMAGGPGPEPGSGGGTAWPLPCPLPACGRRHRLGPGRGSRGISGPLLVARLLEPAVQRAPVDAEDARGLLPPTAFIS